MPKRSGFGLKPQARVVGLTQAPRLGLS